MRFNGINTSIQTPFGYPRASIEHISSSAVRMMAGNLVAIMRHE